MKFTSKAVYQSLSMSHIFPLHVGRGKQASFLPQQDFTSVKQDSYLSQISVWQDSQIRSETAIIQHHIVPIYKYTYIYIHICIDGYTYF